MAVKSLTPTKCGYNEIKEFDFEAPTAVADGCEFIFPAKDEDVQVIVYNSAASAATVTVKAPVDGHYASAGDDLKLSIAASKYAIIRLESAVYADKNEKVKIITSATTAKVAVLY